MVAVLRALLLVVAGVLYGFGWVAGKVWLPVVWCGTAVRVGFRDATIPQSSTTASRPVQRPAPETGVPVRPAV